MLNIIWGRAGSGKTHMLLEKICELARKDNSEKRQILLVPEPFSHECERMLAKTGGARICLSAEVLSFKRMADRVFERDGGLALDVLDEGGRLLTMRLASEMVRERLTVFAKNAYNPAFLQSVLHTADECKCYGISPDQLYSAANEAQGHSAAKLRDIAHIYAAYHALLTQNGSPDPRDRLTIMAEKLEEGDFALGVSLFIDSFVTFTPQEQRIIEIFIRKADSVTIALCGTPEDEFFSVVQRQAAKLIDKSGEVNIGVLTEQYRYKNPVLAFLERYLFSPEPPAAAPVKDEAQRPVEITVLPSIADECGYIAEKVIQLVKDGMRYRDIVIITPDLEAYRPHLENALEVRGISYFVDVMDDITQSPLVRLLRCITDICLYGWHLEDILKLLHTGLIHTGIRIDRLEEYLRLWNLHGKNWTGGEEWSFHPRGFESEWTANDNRRLFSANAFRRMLINALHPFRGLHTAREWCERYIAFLTLFKTELLLERRRQRLKSIPVLADKIPQIWDILGVAFGQCTLILGDRLLSLREFGELLLLTLSAYKAGTIPVVLDSVLIGESGRLCRHEALCVLHVGCLPENMPLFAAPQSLLRQEERVALENLNIELPPDDEQRFQRAMLNIYTSFFLAGEKLILTLPLSPGGKLIAAQAVDKIALMTNTPVSILSHQKRTARREQTPNRLSKQMAQRLYGESIHLSAGRIERYFSCPFKYFCQYSLKVKPPPEPGFSPVCVGRLVHEALERTAGEMSLRDKESITGEQVRRWANESAILYAGRVLNNFMGFSRQFAVVFDFLTKSIENIAEFIWKDIEKSEFILLGQEIEFSEICLQPDTNGGQLYDLSGKIDRADLWESPEGYKYLRVIDYKTGNIAFPYKEIYHGLKMQMPLYLFALTVQEPSLIPAGVLYFQAQDKRVVLESRLIKSGEDNESRMRFDGLLLSDENVLKAMGTSPEQPSPFYPVKWKKDGSLTKRSQVAARHQWESLKAHVASMTAKAAAGIAGGDVCERPVFYSKTHKACDFCDYRMCCHFNEAIDEKVWIESLSAEELWGLLE